jgi:hypothetical protein
LSAIAIFGWFTTIVIAAIASIVWHVQLRPFSVKEVAALAVDALMWGTLTLLRTNVVLWWLQRSFFRDAAETLADVLSTGVDSLLRKTQSDPAATMPGDVDAQTI